MEPSGHNKDSRIDTEYDRAKVPLYNLDNLSLLISEGLWGIPEFPSDRGVFLLSRKFAENTAIAGKTEKYPETLTTSIRKG